MFWAGEWTRLIFYQRIVRKEDWVRVWGGGEKMRFLRVVESWCEIGIAETWNGHGTLLAGGKVLRQSSKKYIQGNHRKILFWAGLRKVWNNRIIE